MQWLRCVSLTVHFQCAAVTSWQFLTCLSSVIYNWAATTSKYIKSLDSNHMVTIGDEGFGPLTGGDGSYPYQAGAGGYTWVDNLNISTLDFGTLHLYPDSCESLRNATWYRIVH